MDLKPFIQRIIDEIGPRPAGSDAELKAGRVIAAEFKKRGATISTQDVPVAPGIITGLINVLTGVYLISAVCYFFVPVVSALLVAAFLTLLILSRQFGNGVIDWMFKKTTTRNIMATFAPKGKRTQTLIFSGHHDSPDMMPMLGAQDQAVRPPHRAVDRHRHGAAHPGGDPPRDTLGAGDLAPVRPGLV